MVERTILVAGLVLISVLLAAWWRRRDGRVRTTGSGPFAVTSAVLVSTPSCATCPRVRSLLAEVAGRREDFSWEEVDAGREPWFARDHGVLRAPTVLFRDASGAVVARAAGAIDDEQVRAVVAG